MWDDNVANCSAPVRLADLLPAAWRAKPTDLRIIGIINQAGLPFDFELEGKLPALNRQSAERDNGSYPSPRLPTVRLHLCNAGWIVESTQSAILAAQALIDRHRIAGAELEFDFAEFDLAMGDKHQSVISGISNNVSIHALLKQHHSDCASYVDLRRFVDAIPHRSISALPPA